MSPQSTGRNGTAPMILPPLTIDEGTLRDGLGSLAATTTTCLS